jgi:hypothetical protein
VGEAFAGAADALVQQQSLDPELPTELMLTELFERVIGRDGTARGGGRSPAARRTAASGRRSAS